MNLFQLIPASFYSAKAYRQMRAAASFGMGYALVMVLITTLAVVVYFSNTLHRELFAPRGSAPSFAREIAAQITEQMPLMTFDKGVLMTDNPEIYTIRLSGTLFKESFSNVPVATIDTTGQTTYETMKTPLLINSKEVVIETDNKKEIKSFSEISGEEPKGPIIINKAMTESTLNSMITWFEDNAFEIYLIFGGMFWVFAIIYMFVMRMVMLFLLGLVGIAYASIRNVQLSYASAVGIASLSYTPVLLLDTLLFIARGDSPSTFTLFIAGAVTLIAGITASQPPKDTPMVG